MSDHPNVSRTPVWLKVLRYAFIAVVVIAVLFGYSIVRLYTDWLWFGELKRTSVYLTTIQTRLMLFFGMGLSFFLIAYLNLWIALRSEKPARGVRMLNSEQEQIIEFIKRGIGWLALAGALIVAFLVAGNASTHWSSYLLFTHAGTFGQADPVFNQDVGFYVFRLPFLTYLQGWLLFTLGATAIGTAVVYLVQSGTDLAQGQALNLPLHAQRHLLMLGAAFAAVFAWGHYLARFDLLVAENGAYFGAGYTDLHARLPGQNIQTVLMLLTAAFCLMALRSANPPRLPLVGLALWAVGSGLVVGVWPNFVQKFQVVPNQFGAEKEYIARDIEFTRKAYGLDNIKEQTVPVSVNLTAAELAADKPTIDNVRLWDWPQLGAVYSIKQVIRPYYQFQLPATATTTSSNYNIDIDRYRLGGEYRQVMLAAREMFTEGLPQQAQTWQNERLVYTHGYGAVMSPVNRVDADGMPEYFMQGVPVRSEKPELKLDRPQIYYGELTNDYVMVNSKADEFDYPEEGNVNRETRYAGEGGTALGGGLRRMAWSILLGDTNLLLSGDLTAESRILYRRNIRERVQKLAPFLNWDNDPYLVVLGGKLVWLMDAYTVTDRYPYSKPTYTGTGVDGVQQGFNYIRNSVKAVVDAYDGTVTMYVSAPDDPIVKTWMRVFPGLFTAMDKMPQPLRAHLRYPEDLFRIQRDVYTVYHISDPRVYYGKEDQWEVPQDPTPQLDAEGNADQNVRMQPYYLVMRLPGEKDEEFMMISPYTPLRTPTLSAWMCAKCDPDDYGQLVVYRFPKGTPMNGPAQVMAQIQSQEDISKTMTLLGQRGSSVIIGNLLAIPIGKSVLYAAPLYVQAKAGGAASVLPEVNQVIVSNGDRVLMRPNLEMAIAALGSFGGSADTARASGSGTTQAVSAAVAGALQPAGGSREELIRRANAAFDRARAKQKDYDAALDELGDALRRLQASSPSPPAKP